MTNVYVCAYNERAEFEWDPDKANANFRKHAVLFSNASTVLEDELAITIRDPYSDEEERWISVGLDLFGNLTLVVYVWRGETIRLISARPAAQRERGEYVRGRSNKP